MQTSTALRVARRAALGLLVAAACALAAFPAAAQRVRPSQQELEVPTYEGEGGPLLRPLPDVPDFEPPAEEPGTLLPPLDIGGETGTESLSVGERVRVDEIEILGNTVLAHHQLQSVTGRYVRRDLSFSDLERLRDELTEAYVKRGYVTSGAVIPEQSLADGVLEIQIVEGSLERIDVTTDGRFRESALRSRIERGAGPPVHVGELEQQLQVLQEDPRIRSVHAALVPSEERGESILRVEVEERPPWRIRLQGDNYVSPTIAPARGGIEAAFTNVSGWGDEIAVEYYGGGKGLHDVQGAYEIPLGAFDTSLELRVRRTWSEVIEEPFEDLDIESRTQSYGLTLYQPVPRARGLELFLTGEWRRSKSFLLGEGFSFVPGPDEGEATISVLRFGGDWALRAREQVLALRSTFSVGLQVLDATENPGDTPDGQFFDWLLQLQYAQRLPWLDAQLIAGGELQLSSEPLLGLEQFVIGGYDTVRGYRESTLASDQGADGRLELRVPLPLPASERWRPRIEVAPFFDAGHAWNSKRDEVGPQTLVGVGLGLRVELAERLLFEVYWGEALKDVDYLGDYSIQDDGIQMSLTARLP